MKLNKWIFEGVFEREDAAMPENFEYRNEFENTPKGVLEFMREISRIYKTLGYHNSWYENKTRNTALRDMTVELNMNSDPRWHLPDWPNTPLPMVIEWINSKEFKKELRRCTST